MSPGLNAFFVATACIAAGSIAAATSAGAVPKDPLAQAKCSCNCTVDGVVVDNKTFAAPGGDPKACPKQDGTKCRSGEKVGVLDVCSGFVEAPKAPPTKVQPKVEPGGVETPKITPKVLPKVQPGGAETPGTTSPNVPPKGGIQRY